VESTGGKEGERKKGNGLVRLREVAFCWGGNKDPLILASTVCILQSYYTIGHKNVALYFCQYLCQLLADF